VIEPPAAAPDVVIAPMRRRHLRGVVRIEEETNHRPWSQSLFAGELKMPASRNYVVALAGAVVVGFGGVMYVGDDAHLTTIAVHPAEQRNQIGSRLLLALTRCAVHDGVEAMTLEVRATNRGAQEMYRQFGYAPGGIRPQYYKDVGEDALIMWAHDLSSAVMAERLDTIETGLRNPMRTIGLGLNAA
jgi:ribosomal-protein-alanine N-acetyltransferase